MASNQTVARIDLKQRTFQIQDFSFRHPQHFLGGRGLSTCLLFQHLPKGVHPLKPGNVVVIGVGPLAGSMASPFQYLGIVTKSPLTKSITCASIPGPFAAQMRWSGFDQLILTEKARQPTYLLIQDKRIEFRDASHLKSKSVSDTLDTIKNELKDDNIRALILGPAGENRVTFANITTDYGQSAGWTGVGAVLGSKNIKAIACRGTRDIFFNQPEHLLAFQQQILDQFAAYAAAPSDVDAGRTEKTPEIAIHDLNLDDCPGTDEDLRGSETRMLTELGLDVFATRCMLDWMFGLAEAGIITKRRLAGLPDFKNNAQTRLHIVKEMVDKKGIGASLALGPLEALKNRFPAGLVYFPSPAHLIRMLTEDRVDPFSPAQLKTYFSATKASITPSPVFDQELAERAIPSRRSASSKMLRGRTIAGPEIIEIIAGNLGLCPIPVFEKSNTHEILGMYGKLLQMATGLSLNPDELTQVAHRTYSLQRLLNIRETVAQEQSGSVEIFPEIPDSLQMSPDAWKNIDLKQLRQRVSRHFRRQGWDRRSIQKLSVFKELEIETLWPLMK